MTDPDLRFDLNLREEDLLDALHAFCWESGRAYIVDDRPAGNGVVIAADLSFQDALRLLLPTGYQAVEIGGVYHVRRKPEAA